MKLFIVIIVSLTLSIMADEKEALKKSIVKLNSMRVELLNKHKIPHNHSSQLPAMSAKSTNV